MRISDLIKELEKAEAEYGDLEVLHFDIDEGESELFWAVNEDESERRIMLFGEETAEVLEEAEEEEE